jgi:hypothetical protein
MLLSLGKYNLAESALLDLNGPLSLKMAGNLYSECSHLILTRE